MRYDDGTAVTYYYYVCNWRGDVVALYSDTALVCKYDYDAWGNVTSVKDADGTSITSSTHIANINPIRYRGYYYDYETGMYYLGSRYYDPATRRFINADDNSVLLDEYQGCNQYNLFAYCMNNPVNMDDQEGNVASRIIGAVVGGLVGAALGVLLAKKLGLTGWKKWALISAATIGGAALGSFLGPYVAKLGSSVVAKL